MDTNQEPVEICIMDLFQLHRPLEESCFSEQQINTLFQLWRKFMVQRFEAGESHSKAMEDVDKLYNYSGTVEQKYNALRLDQNSGVDNTGPALSLHEEKWVMGDSSPTPFIVFIKNQPEIIENLKMSFRPVINHLGVIEPGDIVNLMLRYVFWLNKNPKTSLNIVRISNVYNEKFSDVSLANMVKSLETKWNSFRFHLAIFSDEYWRCVLIDRETKSFEYYDPTGYNEDILNSKSLSSIYVKKLYDAAIKAEPKLKSKTMKLVRRGFHASKPKARECGMYVIMFTHSRIVEEKSYQDFVNTNFDKIPCGKLREIFYDIKIKENRANIFQSNDPRLKYGAYEYRLGIIEYTRYMEYAIRITSDDKLKTLLKQQQELLLNLAKSPTSYNNIRSKGSEVQNVLLSVLPTQFKVYAGTDTWFQIIQEITTDPLTEYLRNISKTKTKGSRSHNTVRKKFASKVYRDIVKWKSQPGAPIDKVREMDMYVRDVIDNIYIPILLFSPDNKRNYNVGMIPESFIMATMARQDSVSFGVHFLRELDNWVHENINRPRNEILSEEYPSESLVVKPLSLDNIDEIKQVVTKCDETIKKTYELLKKTFTERMTLQEEVVRSSENKDPIGAIPLETSQLEQKKVEQLVILNESDIMNHTFLVSGLKPWNFPINLPHFQSINPKIVLPNEFQIYSVNEADMKWLLQQPKFKLYYAIAIKIALHGIETSQLSDMIILVIVTSLVEFLNAAQQDGDEKYIWCVLLDSVYKQLRGNEQLKTRLKSIIKYLGTYNLQCKNLKARDKTKEFFKNVKEEYEKVLKK